MPCLNEATNLKETCLSLGFGGDNEHEPARTALVIIDNGSIDCTAEIAEKIRRTSKPETVHVVYEPQQGFVPARHAGNLFAQRLAESSGWKDEQVLILQVDADCEYLPGYVAAMREEAEAQPANVMIEACIGYPLAFQQQHEEYVRICNQTDVEFEKLFPRSLSHDDVAVDAVCGYWLADYFRWGGHRREFNAAGDEIYAETTRMFMRARTYGAQRQRVNEGLALHSARKAFADPALHIATAGFPREESWNRKWRKAYNGPSSIQELCAQSDHPEVQKAICIREEHLLALFGVLPLHVDKALGQASDRSAETADIAAHILPLLPARTREDLAFRPGVLISDVFDLISAHGGQLLSEARQVMSKLAT
jgi:glycosyltransferase involved in cell wall biosynthesis